MNEDQHPAVTFAWVVAFLVVFALLRDEPLGWFALAGILGFVLAQWLHTRTLHERLRERVRQLEAQLEKREALASIPPAARVDAAPAAPVATAAPRPVAVAPPAPRPRPIPVPPAPVPPSPFEVWLKNVIGWFTRGNPLARAGIVVLFFGGAFLAKYAAEHSHFPIEARFIAIALTAVGLLAVGWRLRDSHRIYARILQGGGVAGFYLTVFAATKLYQLLPPAFALALMVVVAITSALLAVAQDALALAVIGTAGGFLAPLLVNTGSSNHIALFSYYAALNLGIFTVAWFRAWRSLNLLGFIFTFGIAGLFRAMSYSDDQLWSTEAFLLLYFLMYVGVTVLFSLRQKTELKGYISSSLVFGVPLAAFAIQVSLVRDIEYAVAWSALGLGAFYVALAAGLQRTGRDTFALLKEAFAALGIIFASLAVPLAFDAQVTASTWAVEGAGLLWLGVRQQRRLARAFGALLQIGAGVGCLIGLQHAHSQMAVANSAYLGLVMLSIAGLLSGRGLHAHRDALSRYERGWSAAAAIWAALWWLGGGLREIHHWVLQEHECGAALLLLAASMPALQLLAERWRWNLLAFIAQAYAAWAVLLGVGGAARIDHPLDHLACAGWPALFAAQYFMLRRQDRASPSQLPLPALHAVTAWLLALLLAWEAQWRIAQEVGGVWSS
ncbi:MAG TPA: DUF2339 domain-containing protein, partial [Nevskiaceae bacterium]|nr:DUF2339 domain-containing protein [Nevskiaceae bacterium]